MLRRCATWPLWNESFCSCCGEHGVRADSSEAIPTMEDASPRVLIYILRHDVRLSDNPIFHAASLEFLKTKQSTKATPHTDTHLRDDSSVSGQDPLSFTHLLPVYIFPANQVEVSGFIPDSTKECPYPPAQSHVAGLWRTGPHRAKFMADGVWDLKDRLESLGSGSSLHIRVGKTGEVVEDILQWYANEKDAGRSKVDIAGIWMTAEEGSEEKSDETDVQRVASDRGVNLRVWNDEKYYIDEWVAPFISAQFQSQQYRKLMAWQSGSRISRHR